MSTDYAEWEREFLSSLKEDTGRDLAEWMVLISAQGFSDKNDIIDWLRAKGFMFSKASWLERVHHNGGRPVYGDAASARLPPLPGAPALPHEPVSTAPLPASAAGHQPKHSASPAPAIALQSVNHPPSAPEALDGLLAKGKALRPLAQLLLREVQRAVPPVETQVHPQHVALIASHEFGVLLIGPRELKFGLTLAGEPFDAPWKAAKFAAPGPRISAAITHVAALNDARQINEKLISAIKLAAQPKD